MKALSNSELRDVSQGFIETYLDVVLHQCFAYEPEKYCKVTNDESPAFQQARLFALIDRLGELEKDSLEGYIKSHHSIALLYIHNLLKKVHSVTVSLNPKYFYLGIGEISDERQFDLAIIRIIAGAAIVVLDPEWFSQEGLDAGAIEYVGLNARVHKKMQIALEASEDEGTILPDLFKKQLKLLANGIPLISQYNPTEERLQLMVREITLISNQLLTISNSGENRFPAKAIMAIGEILNLQLPTERTISKLQEKIETEIDSHESPLSDNIHDLPF